MKEDDNLWGQYTKGVKRIFAPKIKTSRPGKQKPFPPRSLISEGLPLKPKSQAEVYTAPPSFQDGLVNTPKFMSSRLDKKTEKEIKNGTLRLHAQLDLHGMTQMEAHQALSQFLRKQIELNHRNLLVVTGKGSAQPDGKVSGVLRSKIKDWLFTLDGSDRILKFCPAAIRHGGAGAFYVLLKNPNK